MDWKQYQRLVTEAELLVWNAPAREEAPDLLSRVQKLHGRVTALRFLRWRFLQTQRFRDEIASLKRICNETVRLCYQAGRIRRTLDGWTNLPNWVGGPQRLQLASRIESIQTRLATICVPISCEPDLFAAENAVLEIARYADSLNRFLEGFGEAYADLLKLGPSDNIQHWAALDELQRRWDADGFEDWESEIASIRSQISARTHRAGSKGDERR
jgi:hypothetical protein